MPVPPQPDPPGLQLHVSRLLSTVPPLSMGTSSSSIPSQHGLFLLFTGILERSLLHCISMSLYVQIT